jgi:hypothetical protein
MRHDIGILRAMLVVMFMTCGCAKKLTAPVPPLREAGQVRLTEILIGPLNRTQRRSRRRNRRPSRSEMPFGGAVCLLNLPEQIPRRVERESLGGS